MEKTAGHDEHDEVARQRRGGRRPPRRAAAAAALLAVAALAAGCSGSSGSSVASVGSSQPAVTGKSSTKPSTLAFAECMIAHGINNFPEPNSKGQLSISKGGLPDLNSPQFAAAEAACASLRAAGTALSPAQQAQHQAALVKYANCMRAHGVPAFPDPGTSGTFDLGGINADSPQVEAADKACSSPGVGIFQPQPVSAPTSA